MTSRNHGSGRDRGWDNYRVRGRREGDKAVFVGWRRDVLVLRGRPLQGNCTFDNSQNVKMRLPRLVTLPRFENSRNVDMNLLTSTLLFCAVFGGVQDSHAYQFLITISEEDALSARNFVSVVF
jgi:hypothetical protein